MNTKKLLLIILTFFVISLACTIGLVWIFIDKDPYDLPGVPGDVEQKGDRLFGIAISDRADDDFGKAFADATSTGIDFITLAQQWDDIETSPGVYYGGETNNLLKIANDYYSAYNMKVAIDINPVDTVNSRVPEDLKSLDLNNSQVITRYNNMLDWIFTQIPDLDLVCFGIGNEVDAYFGDDNYNWECFQDFYSATSAHLRTINSTVPIGTKATFSGLTTGASSIYLDWINAGSDVILATYYPMDINFEFKDVSVVKDDFDTICTRYNPKQIYFLEVGYSSSQSINSSLNKQAQFVQSVFRAWDTHKSQINAVCFVWLYDITQSTLDYYEDYYGFSDPNFLAYLATLGLMNSDYSAKPAFNILKVEALTRGWS